MASFQARVVRVKILSARADGNLGCTTCAANFLCASTAFALLNRRDLASLLQVTLAQANQRYVNILWIV